MSYRGTFYRFTFFVDELFLFFGIGGTISCGVPGRGTGEVLG